MNPRSNADMRGSSRELQEETFVETVALSIARVLAGGAGFLLGRACVIHAGPGCSKPSFHLLPTFRHSGAWPPEAAMDLRKQLSQCLKLFMASRLREELFARCIFAVHLPDANMKT